MSHADFAARVMYCLAFAVAASSAGWPLWVGLVVVLAVNVLANAYERLRS